jgi:hypothetical protein
VAVVVHTAGAVCAVAAAGEDGGAVMQGAQGQGEGEVGRVLSR